MFDAVLGTSPPTGAGATLHHSYSMPERGSAALSSSAPISILSRKGSRTELASRQSGSGRPGLLSEQLGRPSPGRQPETPPRTSVNGFPEGEGPAVPLAASTSVPGGNGAYAHLAERVSERVSERVGSAGSRWAGGARRPGGRGWRERLGLGCEAWCCGSAWDRRRPADAPPPPPRRSGAPGNGLHLTPQQLVGQAHDTLQWGKVTEQLALLSDHVGRTGSLQLQLDAMLHQYRCAGPQGGGALGRCC